MVRKLLRFFDVQSMRVKDCYAAMNFQRFGKKSWNPIMFTPRTKQKQTRFLKLSIFGQEWFSIIFQVDAKPFPQVSGHCHLALTSSKLLPEITASTSQTCIMMPPKATLENHPHRAVFSKSRGFFWDKIGFWFGIFFLDWWTLKLSWTCGEQHVQWLQGGKHDLGVISGSNIRLNRICARFCFTSQLRWYSL